MNDRFRHHIDRLVADAEAEAAGGEWGAARSLAEAALSLDPDHGGAHRVLRGAQTDLARTGERRELTVMFSDVVGSTQMASQAEPEVVGDILRAYQGTCAAVIGQYDGHVAAYVGDGIVAYFGYPTAHEDDPHRAVRAGLELLEALEEVSASARDRYELPFAVRVAIHTGLVVGAGMGTRTLPDLDAIAASTPNIAARLQEQAAPGTLVISEAVRDRVRTAFAVRPLGAVALRGVPGPIDAFEVLREARLVPSGPA